MGRFSRIACAIVVAGAAGCGDQTPLSFNEPTTSGDPALANASFCAGTNSSVTHDAGGTLDCLNFALVGDTRPATIDDTSAYPKAIAGQIWEDIQNESPRPSFALTTGDYIFARPAGTQGPVQMDLYLAAQASFTNPVYHAMGNHECTGATNSNCVGTTATTNKNFNAFLSKMIQGTKPYYVRKFAASDNRWTAKLVVIAANAWDSAQATWLEQTMSDATTYTFVVRHEADYANTAPGVTPSGAILAQHPYTLLLVGHTHTFDWLPSKRELVIGLGGAPITGSYNYGYIVARERTDGAIQFALKDSTTHAVVKTIAVDATGHVVPNIAGGTPTPTPSHTPTPTPTHTPSPTPTPSATDLISNGNFESTLSGWTLGGAKDPIDSTAEAHAGTHALRCGATTSTDPNGDSFAWQEVTIPAGSTTATLSFWYYASSAAPTVDWQAAEIQDSTGHTLKQIFHGGDNSKVWTEKSIDVSAYAGQSLRIWFDTHGNGGTAPTTLWVDEVSLVAQ